MDSERLNTGMQELTEDECLRLLDTQEYGRIGLVFDGRPEIFPINYTLDQDGRVIFKTVAGIKLASALNRPVVFEVDLVDRATHTGWSVVVHGVAHHLEGPAAPPRPLAPWLADRAYLVRIDPQWVTGRFIGPRPEELDNSRP
jgi:nitroimidazol reductase NimA-like FMN-containing flavoprotein (pyridoxamine 5'-phosphate oxidase superfamily)